MARSPFTLAASVTSALPQAGVVAVGALTEGTAGRYDSALVDLSDGRRVVARVPADADAASEILAETRALRALTAGVRALLPFRPPTLLGEMRLEGATGIVVEFLPGYRVDAVHLPPGRGAATSLGAALAAVHALPTSIVRSEGLPSRAPEQVRADVATLVDRAEASDRVPFPLLRRWRRAIAAEQLWGFEPRVMLGGVNPASFVFDDVADVPRVTGLLEWHGLQVGDPALDLHWLAGAPVAADDVFGSYLAHSDRAPDPHMRDRSRFYAELEFAKWLLHGLALGRPDVVDDAAELLASLSTGVADDDVLGHGGPDVDDALTFIDRMPEGAASGIDTSMQTDAYDPAELSFWTEDTDTGTLGNSTEEHAASDAETGVVDETPAHTDSGPLAPWPGAPADSADTDEETDRASREALRRWRAR